MQRQRIALWALVLGLSFVYLSFGVLKFIAPGDWIGFAPDWMDDLLGLSVETWLRVIAAAEVLIGLGILTTVRKVRQVIAVVMMVHLAAVLLAGGWSDASIMNVGLLAQRLRSFFLL